MIPFHALLVLASTLGAAPVNPLNTADLAERCPASRFSLSEDDFGWDAVMRKARAGFHEKNEDLLFADLILHGKIRMQPFPVVMTLIKERNYYARRKAVQAAFTQRIAGIHDAKVKEAAYGNYALLLMYLGEFQQVIDSFGPGAPQHAAFLKDADVTFALANSYWRLHLWKEASTYSRIAFDLDNALDTRWMLMLSDVGLYGKDFMAKHDPKAYETLHVREIFAVKDWSRLPFEDVSDAMGLHRMGGTGSDSFIDLDGDGWDDLIYERKFMPFELYKNDHGHFVLQPEAKTGSDNCAMIVAVPGDFDNDGKPDIFRHCCNYDGAGPTVLLHNLGELTFADVTKKSGLAFSKGYGMVASWGDYDLDGYLDLSVGDANGTSRLYHNTGHGTFVDVTKKAGVTTPGGVAGGGGFGTVGTAWGDLDGDGYPDLYIQGWGWKRLFMNGRDGTFHDVSVAAGLDQSKDVKGYTCQLFDYDGDGKLDLYTGQYVVSSGVKWGFQPICTCSNLLSFDGYKEHEWLHASTIYRNNGDGTFKDMAAKTHFIPLGTMGANNGDWDNDGDQDIVQGAGGPYFQQAEPYLFYENDGDGTFTLVTPFTDLRLWGKGHGASFADYDHDGNLDLVLNNGGAAPGDLWPSLLLHNKGNANHWLEVALEPGPGTNAMALGAKLEVTAGGKTYVQELWSGGRFGAANGSRVHFGLGKATKIERISIRWPNKKLDTTVLEDVAVDQAISVNEITGASRQLWSFPHGVATTHAEGQPLQVKPVKAP